MKQALICSFTGAVALSVSCVTRDYNKSGLNKSSSQNVESQVNPMAFNALKIWNGEIEADSREVFDFCTAGTPQLMNDKSYAAKYPKDGRCAERFVLSATVSAWDLNRAFRFSGWDGLMAAKHRSFNAVSSPGSVTRCVGR